MLERIISILIGYACGLFQTAYIYGRINHIDIRNHGSGNAGTTNALRTLGKKAGILTFLGDFIKPMAAALFVWLLFRGNKDVRVLETYAGLGAILGHIFPFYLKFRGGKGIATIAGVSTVFCFRGGCLYVIPVMMLFFAVVVAVTRYVSVGSICAVLACFAWIVIEGQRGAIAMSRSQLYEAYALIAVYTLIAIAKHRANIKRLLKGTENKIFQKKEK